MAILAVCTGACSRCIEPQTSRETDQRVAADRAPRRGRADQVLLSTLPRNIHIRDLVDAAKLRWRIRRDYQELKQEVGSGTTRTRVAWLPPSRHAIISAYGFLISERRRFPLRISFPAPLPQLARTRRLPTPRSPMRPERTSQTPIATHAPKPHRRFIRTPPRCPCCGGSTV